MCRAVDARNVEIKNSESQRIHPVAAITMNCFIKIGLPNFSDGSDCMERGHAEEHRHRENGGKEMVFADSRRSGSYFHNYIFHLLNLIAAVQPFHLQCTNRSTNSQPEPKNARYRPNHGNGSFSFAGPPRTTAMIAIHNYSISIKYLNLSAASFNEISSSAREAHG